jgi:hypothetical protein
MSVTFSTTATRTGGDTPLSVFFDGTGSTSTQTTDPVLACEFFWDIYKEGTYVSSRKGAAVAIIFDTTDSYEVKLTIVEPDGIATQQGTGLTIQPTAFDGTTYVIAQDGVFTGAPSGTQITSGNFKTVLDTYAAEDVRFLFKRGNTFTSSSECRYDDYDHCRIGAWGTGTGLNATYGYYSNDPVFSQASGSWPSGQWTMLIIAVQDIAIEHINFTAVATTTQQAWYMLGSSLDYNLEDATIYKCQFSNNETGSEGSLGMNPNFSYQLEDNMPYRITAQNCNFGAAPGINVFFGGRFSSLHNCNVGASATSHCVRMDYGWKSELSHLTITDPATQRHGIKLHAPTNRSYSDSYGDIEWTDYVSITGCTILVSQSQSTPVDIAPQDSGADEWLRNIVCDGNVAKVTALNGNGVSTMFNWCQADGMTFRNNIFTDRYWNGVSSSWAQMCRIEERYSGGVTPQNIRFYGNLVYSTVDAGRNGIVIAAYASGNDYTDVIAANNIVYTAQGETKVDVLRREDWNAINNATVTNNLLLANDLPETADFTDEDNDDFTIGTSSDAIGAGSSTYKVNVDLAGNVHNSTPDIGPYGYDTDDYSPSPGGGGGGGGTAPRRLAGLPTMLKVFRKTGRR